MALRLRFSSVSGKILGAFLVIMVMFGGVTTYSTLTMRRLGDELHRISSGYLTLRLEVQDLQTRQDNLLRLLERATQDLGHEPIFVKSAIDNARNFRRINLHKVSELVVSLRAAELRISEDVFLRDVAERLQAIDGGFIEDEEYFNRLYGPPRSQPLVLPQAEEQFTRERLLRREEKLWRDEAELSKMLRGRVQLASIRLEVDLRHAQYATLVGVVIAALLALGVMALAQRALLPLRRLASSAKQLAGGDLKQRVQVTSNDEISALAGEFNAMAAALEERELRLIRSERLAAVGKIAAQITHEVRNPLSSIGLNAELIIDELERSAANWNASEARELTRAIIQEVDRLTEITEQYLRLARLPRPKLEPEDVNAIISSLLNFVTGDMVARGIVVTTQLDSTLPLVQADENQLRQALLNLLRNAVEAMPHGGSLKLETRLCREGKPLAELRITDTGEGMTEEVRGRIFDAFFSTKVGGTGLGLALTQQIIVDHGGTVEVESAPGHGSCFVVRLPIETDLVAGAGGTTAQPTEKVI